MARCLNCIHFDVCDTDRHEKERLYGDCRDFLNDADVVEVVRCCDCAHWIEIKGFDYKGRKARSCIWYSTLTYENDYCSCGIRRTPKERGGVEK